jgi:hypothetical protein
MSSRVAAKSRAALERLIQVAQGDTGQSRIVANFLLATREEFRNQGIQTELDRQKGKEPPK